MSTLPVAVGLLLVLAVLAACGKPPEVAKAPCPAKGLASYTALDLSHSARGEDLLADRLRLVRGILTETAVCSGTARVVAFSNSEAATATLFDADLHPEGATDQARRRRAPKLIDEAMATVDRNLERAKMTLPGGGTDVVAQLRLLNEFHHQIGTDRPLVARILTDGISTTGVVLNRADLTESLAVELANSIALPSLAKSTEVVFAGVGKVAGPDLPPTAFTDAVKTFFSTVCNRLGAKTCVPVSDLIMGVKK